MTLYGVDLNNMEAAVFERRGEVAIVTLNRPESANALNTEMHRDVGACWHEINENDGIKAAVVTGAGRFFCAGRDLNEYVGQYGSGDTSALRSIDDPEHEMFGRLCNHWIIHKPLIGALSGPAVGGGLEMVTMVDMVVMAEDTYILDAHAKVNVGSGDVMFHYFPPMIARAFTMTDRRFTAEECLRWGFASDVVPRDQVLDRAIELAEATTQMGPDAIAKLKQRSIELQLRSGNVHTPEEIEERRRTRRQQIAETATDHDRMEGMKAFVAGRTAEYERSAKPDAS
jgi:crotonobetainyl-CoA hydratase